MKSSRILSHVRTAALRKLILPVAVLALLSVVLTLWPGIPFHTVLLVLAVIVFLAALWYLLLAFFPKLSPCYRRLHHYGTARALLHDADSELEFDLLLKQKDVVLTPKYMVVYRGEHTHVIPLVSVLWVFPEQFLKYSFRDHRRKMYYRLRIMTIAGDTFILRNKKKAELDRVMEILTDRYPNFFYGYSEEHEEMVSYILEENRRELKEKRNR